MRERRKHDRLDRRLESERPQPRDEFVSTLADRLAPEPIRRRPVWRTAVAVGFTMLLVLAFALTGGISYAASAVHGGTTAVAALVTGASNSDKPDKPGQSNKPEQSNGGATEESNAEVSGQSADPKVTICHIPPGNPDNPQTITVSENALPAHLEHGDPLGACPEDPSPPDDQYNEKVLICHIPPGNPENAHTIRVSENAVAAHLAHGDTEGACEN